MISDMRAEHDGRVLVIYVTGKLTAEDYGVFVPEADRLIKLHQKISVLWVMHDFDGWKASALWEELKFAATHLGEVKQLAIVGDRQWHEGIHKFIKPFSTAAVRYFDPHELDDARAWLGLETAHRPTAEEEVSRSGFGYERGM